MKNAGAIRLMFIMPYPVHDKISHAGGQTVNYYLSRFAEDADFEVSFINPYFKRNTDYNLMTKQYKYLTNFSPLISKFNKRIMRWPDKIAKIFSGKRILASSLFEKYIEQALLEAKTWSPDVIILEWTEIVLMQDIVRKIFPKAIIIGSEHDVSFQGFERKIEKSTNIFRKYINENSAQRLKKSELKALSDLNLIVVHNIKDEKLLRPLVENDIHVISPYYHNYYQNKLHNNSNLDILFFGAMGRWENQDAVKWFIENVFYELQKYDNRFRFIVVGGGIDKFAKKYGSDRIKFLGYVEDPDEYFMKSFCMVAPLRFGAGIKVKVLEGMAAGLPVLTNDVGIEGISAIDGIHYFHCDKPVSYIDIIQRLLAQETLHDSVKANARQFIEAQFNLAESYQNYKKKIILMTKQN